MDQKYFPKFLLSFSAQLSLGFHSEIFTLLRLLSSATSESLFSSEDISLFTKRRETLQ